MNSAEFIKSLAGKSRQFQPNPNIFELIPPVAMYDNQEGKLVHVDHTDVSENKVRLTEKYIWLPAGRFSLVGDQD